MTTINTTTTITETIRIGTWNILSYNDEYDIDYGCPLSIAYTTTTTSDDNNNNDSTNNVPVDTSSSSSSKQEMFTQQRYQRIWDYIESISKLYDVLCLQEVSDEFLTLQQQSLSSLSSNWTVMNRNVECVLLLSNHCTYQVVTTYNLSSIPNLSGCGTSIPMMIVVNEHQQQQQYTNNNTILPQHYMIGSVHVQASVTNMTLWYQTMIDTIINNTYHDVTTATNNSNIDWIYTPIMIILGGDYNHNLTLPVNDQSNITFEQNQQLPPNYTNWTLVTTSTNVNNDMTQLPGTTQKEYNYMGYYDGFVMTTSSIQLYTPPPPTSTTTVVTTQYYNNHMNVSNVMGLMKGFMPKVVYGFARPDSINNNVTINDNNDIAQFALVTKTTTSTQLETDNIYNNNNTTMYKFWNRSMVQEWIQSNHTNSNRNNVSSFQLLFSSTSNFHYDNYSFNIDEEISDNVVFVPNSNPFIESLSDHLMISASFHVSSLLPPSNTTIITDTNTSTTTTIVDHNPHDTFAITTFITSPGGWITIIILLIVAIIVIGIIIGKNKCICCFRRSISSQSRPEFDRLSSNQSIQ